jgi:hypothetical protein
MPRGSHRRLRSGSEFGSGDGTMAGPDLEVSRVRSSHTKCVIFLRIQARVECERSGLVYWVTLWPTEHLEAVTSMTSKVRMFCTTPEAAEAFVKCGAKRVNQQLEAR